MLSLHCNKSGSRFCIVIFPRWWHHTLAISGQLITTVSTLEWVSKCQWLFAYRSPHKIFLLASGSAHYKWTRLYMNKLKLPEGMSMWRVCQKIATSVFCFMSSNFPHICTYYKLVFTWPAETKYIVLMLNFLRMILLLTFSFTYYICTIIWVHCSCLFWTHPSWPVFVCVWL